METHNQELLHDELIQLAEKQMDTLEKRRKFGGGGVTEAEEREYEERQERIRDLFIEFHYLEMAA